MRSSFKSYPYLLPICISPHKHISHHHLVFFGAARHLSADPVVWQLWLHVYWIRRVLLQVGWVPPHVVVGVVALPRYAGVEPGRVVASEVGDEVQNHVDV